VGGDDYITKPFSPSELVARVKAHLRRNRLLASTGSPKPVLKFSGLEIDLSSYSVTVNNETISLSAKEFQLLTLLSQNPNRLFNNEQLYDMIWGKDNLGDARTVAVHISNLRKKIESDPSNPKYIITVRGVGYKFYSDETTSDK